MTNRSNRANMGGTMKKASTEPAIEMTPVDETELVMDAKLNRARLPKGSGPRAGEFIPAPIYADFTKRYTEEAIPFNKIRVDMSYQRHRNKYDISKMAHAWDQDIFGRVFASLRKDHYYYMMDGGGRYEALKMITNRPDMIDAFVFRGLTIEQEAALYRKLDTQRRSLTQGSIFKAALAEKDLNALEIAEVAANCGLFIDYDRGPVNNNLRSAGTLTEIHRRIGKKGLQRILRVTSRAWPNSKYAGVSTMLYGLEYFFNRFDEADDRRVIKVLSDTNPKAITSRAHSLNTLGGVLWPKVAKVIHHDYNKLLRTNKLPEWE